MASKNKKNKIHFTNCLQYVLKETRSINFQRTDWKMFDFVTFLTTKRELRIIKFTLPDGQVNFYKAHIYINSLCKIFDD